MTLRWTQHDVDRYLRRGQDPPLSERAWQTIIMRLLTDTGHYIYHTHNSRRSPSGWPDVAAIKPTGGTLYLCELKTDTGIVSQAQQAWLTALAGTSGVVVECWRPSMLEDICQKLRG